MSLLFWLQRALTGVQHLLSVTQVRKGELTSNDPPRGFVSPTSAASAAPGSVLELWRLSCEAWALVQGLDGIHSDS